MRSLVLALSVSVMSVIALSATAAQAMTVREFLAQAEHIPHNPTSALRSDTRRLIGEVTGAVRTVKAEQAAAGRDAAACIPSSGTGISPESLLARLNAIPPARRDMSVTQAIREWMIERYPCR